MHKHATTEKRQSINKRRSIYCVGAWEEVWPFRKWNGKRDYHRFARLCRPKRQTNRENRVNVARFRYFVRYTCGAFVLIVIYLFIFRFLVRCTCSISKILFTQTPINPKTTKKTNQNKPNNKPERKIQTQRTNESTPNINEPKNSTHTEFLR